MDGPFYIDSRTPFISGDVASVTLAVTAKAIVPIANLPVLGSNYFSFVGKAVRIRLFGRITSAATPGNGTLSLYWGNGGDANGTVICASAAHALTANQSNMSWQADLVVRCRSMGATGTLFGTGRLIYNSAIQTVDQLIPATVPAASASLDLTAANVISPQYLRSGSTAESIQVHDISFEALN